MLVAVKGVSEVLSDNWTPAERLQRLAYESLGQPGGDFTNYGTLIKSFDIKLPDGESYTGPYVCPFGLMATLAKSYGAAVEVFEKVLKGRLGTLCFHVDGARLGNVLRPDAGREIQAVTYTFAQFHDKYLFPSY